MKSPMYYWRESLIYAYLMGLIECKSGMGLTHDENEDWNEAYDTGRNHGRLITRHPED